MFLGFDLFLGMSFKVIFDVKILVLLIKSKVFYLSYGRFYFNNGVGGWCVFE